VASADDPCALITVIAGWIIGWSAIAAWTMATPDA
jgi:hypothetical protein